MFNLNYDASKDRTQFGKQWKKPIKIAVSGAAGAIANHLLFTVSFLDGSLGKCLVPCERAAL